ncbi:hypothetical protein [uncultured Kriegella sp.]|uniref:hypothetical protein n=1 Tax=uncultured Kriegella sp. TaxID=1798910 RepID=UPI0030DA17DE|tara:strand:- start:43578 stop:44126 length:549 start_codon:yes stop_codon:yes gene_type:complete
MKHYQNQLWALLLCLVSISCSNDDNHDTETPSKTGGEGTIQLSGPDTTDVGTTLTVGDVAYGRDDLTGIEESIVVVNKGATISEERATGGPANPENLSSIITDDKDNGFVIVVGAGAVSMAILIDGTPYRYGCISEGSTTAFSNCESFDFDIPGKKMVFSNTTVKNTDTGSLLTLDGTVTWD